MMLFFWSTRSTPFCMVLQTRRCIHFKYHKTVAKINSNWQAKCGRVTCKGGDATSNNDPKSRQLRYTNYISSAELQAWSICDILPLSKCFSISMSYGDILIHLKTAFCNQHHVHSWDGHQQNIRGCTRRSKLGGQFDSKSQTHGLVKDRLWLSFCSSWDFSHRDCCFCQRASQ